MATFSQYSAARDQVADINARWKFIEKFLGPTVEALPHLLSIPMVLFVLGLLCTTVIQRSILYTSLSALFAIITAGLLFATLFRVAAFEDHSPFQSSISRFLVALDARAQSMLLKMPLGAGARSIFLKILLFFIEPFAPERKPQNRTTSNSELTPHAEAFHRLVQETHDHSTLDLTVASVFWAIRSEPRRWEYFFAREHADSDTETGQPAQQSAQLLEIECMSLLHFLKEQAGPRSNILAARAITDLAIGIPSKSFRNYPYFVSITMF